MNKIAWIGSILSIIGILLNAYHNIICWPIWCVANGFWIYYSIKTKQNSQLVLWIVFTLANLWAWWKWLH